MTNLFLNNNTSNDYVNPTFSSCSNVSDTYTFEFLPKENVGVSSGSQILMSMGLDDIYQVVTDWSSEKLTLQPGAVAYIPGLTKGLMNRTQVYNIPFTPYTTADDMFMMIDLSIGYYSNFKYSVININASSNYSQNIDIETALDLAFANKSISISTTVDSSKFTFVGDNAGHDFDISSVVLQMKDASMDSNSSIPASATPIVFTLEEDTSAAVPYAKYPNGAMLGYVLKLHYPTDTTISCYDKWIYLNNVPSEISYYEAVNMIGYIQDASDVISYTFDSCTFSIPTFDVSQATDASQNNVYLYDASYYNTLITDCSMLGIWTKSCEILNGVGSQGKYKQTVLSDSSIADSVIVNSHINYYKLLVDACTLEYMYITTDVSQSTASYRTTITDSSVWDSSINNSTISNTVFYNSYILDSSLTNCTLYNCILDGTNRTGNHVYYIDASITNETQLTYDTSVYYNKFTKTVDVGMNGSSTDSVMSAGDYLNYITVNSMWDKVGRISMQLAQIDASTVEKNLINGFYIFNPHSFSTAVEYFVVK